MSAPTDLTTSIPPKVASGIGLQVSEVFGPTFQGEGPSVGRRCTFLRLGGCNLHCSWCDTPYTWDWQGRNGTVYDPRIELRRADWASLWQEIVDQQTGMLVITGGEPLLQQRQLLALLHAAKGAGWWIEVETAGTVAPESEIVEHVDRFNVSPKLANSGNELEIRQRPKALQALQGTGKADWKFVVSDVADLAAIADLQDRFGLAPIWIMPEGTDGDVIANRTRQLADAVLARGWNMTTRLHVLIWGNRRGV